MGHQDALSRGDRLNPNVRANGLPEPSTLNADAILNAAPHQQPWHQWEQVDVFTTQEQTGLRLHVLLICVRCGQYWARVWDHRI